jgi:hypothetical protein
MSGGGLSKSVTALVAALSLLFVQFTGSTPAFAAEEAPDQWSLGDPNGTTRDTPAAVDVLGHEVVAIRGGSDDHVWYSIDGQAFTQIGAITHTAPALAYWGNARGAFLVHTGTDGHLWITSFFTYDGPPSTWRFLNDWDQLPNAGLPSGVQFREVRASLAATDRQLYIIGVGTDERIYWSTVDQYSRLTSPWQEVPGGGRTYSGIAATTTPGGPESPYLFIVHRGTNDRVYYTRRNLDFGTWDYEWDEVPDGYITAYAPSATFHYSSTYGNQVWIGAASSAGIPDYIWVDPQLPRSYHGVWQQAPADSSSASHGGEPLTNSGPTLFRAASGRLVMLLRWYASAYANGWGNHPVQKGLPGT